MTTLILQRAALVAQRLALVSTLAVIGLAVGAGCVVLPLGVPLGIVGIAGILLLWVLPDLQGVPDRLAQRMLFPLIFSTLCIPTYFTIILPGLPWLSARRLILFAFVIPVVLVLAGSSLHRRKVLEVMRGHQFVYGCMLAFLTAFIVSTLMSVKFSDSVNALINTVMGLFLPFAAVLMLPRGVKSIRSVMKLFVYCTIFDAITGFIEFYMRKPFLIFFLPPAIRSQILASNPLYATLFEGQGVRNGLYRAASAFNISLSWGEMACMLAPVAAYFLAHGSTNRDRAFGLIGFVAAFISIVCSGARGAYVGFIAAMIVYVLLWAIRICRTNPASILGPNALAIFGMMSIGVVLAVLFFGPVRSYVLGSGNTQSSTDARWAEWALAKPKILASPLWGYGPGISAEVIDYHPFGSESVTVDSYIMTGLVEYGVVGFFALCSLLFAAILLSFQIYLKDHSESAAMGSALGCSLVAFVVYRITLSQQENMTTMYVILGLVVLLYKLHTRARQRPELSQNESRPMDRRSQVMAV